MPTDPHPKAELPHRWMLIDDRENVRAFTVTLRAAIRAFLKTKFSDDDTADYASDDHGRELMFDHGWRVQRLTKPLKGIADNKDHTDAPYDGRTDDGEVVIWLSPQSTRNR